MNSRFDGRWYEEQYQDTDIPVGSDLTLTVTIQSYQAAWLTVQVEGRSNYSEVRLYHLPHVDSNPQVSFKDITGINVVCTPDFAVSSDPCLNISAITVDGVAQTLEPLHQVVDGLATLPLTNYHLNQGTHNMSLGRKVDMFIGVISGPNNGNRRMAIRKS